MCLSHRVVRLLRARMEINLRCIMGLKKLIKNLKEKLDRFIDKYLDLTDDIEDAKDFNAAKPATQTDKPSPAHDTEGDGLKENGGGGIALDWCWGGFNGSKAKQVDGCVIGSLKVGKKIAYKWVKGGCEILGASSKEDASKTLACFFCRIGGKWLGGKFDWISTSRTSRDFNNVNSGYNGWDKNAISKADAYAFVIVSSDGKKRTNVAVKER